MALHENNYDCQKKERGQKGLRPVIRCVLCRTQEDHHSHRGEDEGKGLECRDGNRQGEDRRGEGCEPDHRERQGEDS